MNLTAQQAASLWAQGKRVLAKRLNAPGDHLGYVRDEHGGSWEPLVFRNPDFTFRLAPGETMEEVKLETPVDDGTKPISIGDAVKAWADMKHVEACEAGELYVYRKPITSPFGANNEDSAWSPNIFTEPGRFTFYLGAGETLDAKPNNQPLPVDDGGPAYPCGPGGDSYHHEDGRVSHQWPAHPGMTLRAYLASRETLADWDNADAAILAKLSESIAGPKPTDGWGDPVAMFAWEARVRAGMKVIRADALLAELRRKA